METKKLTDEQRKEYSRLLIEIAKAKVRVEETLGGPLEEYIKAVRKDIAASDNLSAFWQEMDSKGN